MSLRHHVIVALAKYSPAFFGSSQYVTSIINTRSSASGGQSPILLSFWGLFRTALRDFRPADPEMNLLSQVLDWPVRRVLRHDVVMALTDTRRSCQEQRHVSKNRRH